MDEKENNPIAEENTGSLTSEFEEAEKPVISESENNIIIPATEGKGEEPHIPVVSRAKKLNIKWLIAALCLVCALVGGFVGGGISGAIVRSSLREEGSAAPVQETTTRAETTTTQTVKLTEPAREEDAIISGEAQDEDATTVVTLLSPKEVYDKNVACVVGVEGKKSGGTSYGTGFIVSSSGYVVTNYHVVDGCTSYTLSLYNSREYEAELVGYEQSNDIAVLKFQPEGNIQSLVYGQSSTLSVGDPIYIIGNPLGDLTFTLTTGVVSALNRIITVDDGSMVNMFQTDAAVNNGNSGGPVFDQYGYVVGISTAKYSSTAIAIEGLGFCIPIDDVRTMIDDIINYGYVSGKALMGISVYDTVSTNYGFFSSSRRLNGAKVAAVGSNSAAVNSGIRVDDVITAVDGVEVDSVSKLKTIIAYHRSGDKLELTVERDSRELTLTMTLDEYSPSEARTNYSNVYDL